MKRTRININFLSSCQLILILLFCFILQLSVQGVVYVNKNAAGANNGNSWADAYTTIQAGINDADVADEEVWVAQGTYPEAITMLSGAKLYGGFNGTETSRSQRNWTTNITTIDGSTARGGLPAYHTVTMDSITSCTIDGFTITGGNANGPTEPYDINGGGIYCVNLNNTNSIVNNIISGNSATYCGGILCYYSSITITNNKISGNSAIDDGGGIGCSNSSSTINNNTISGNSATDCAGGISCWQSSDTIMKNTIIENSASNAGGGIYCDNSSDCIIMNNIILENSAYEGGGIECTYSSPTIINNTISLNSANNNGGGIYCGYSSPTIKNTIFYNNNKYDIFEQDANTDPFVSYNDFYGNIDGCYYDEGITPYTSVSAMDSAIPECSNDIGLNPLFVSDTIIVGTWTANAVYHSNTFHSILTNSSASWTNDSLTKKLINPDTSQNKQFVIVSNTKTTIIVWGNITSIAHTGDTYKIFDYHLQSTSPCIDAGCLISGLTEDFEGDPRPFNGTSQIRGDGSDYDIGADEYNHSVGVNNWILYE